MIKSTILKFLWLLLYGVITYSFDHEADNECKEDQNDTVDDIFVALSLEIISILAR